jgi:hypothetical protein
VRLLFAFTFVLIVAVLPGPYAAMVALAWGFLLLGFLSYVLARVRGVSSLAEVGKHFTVAVAVIVVSRMIGLWILHFHGIAP